jgi:hypothetical protein
MYHEFQFLGFQDFKYFSERFNEFACCGEDSIPFDCLREITYSFDKFNRQKAIESLDNFLQSTKVNINRFKESDILIRNHYS